MNKNKKGRKSSLDPVSLEIIWSRLISITDEQAAVVLRTAFSSVVRESHDFTCILLTPDGDLLAQPYQSLPGFTKSASVVMKHFLSIWKEWHPDDVAITNDAWIGTGHLNDIAVAVPIFHRNKLVAFASNIAHQADIGGRGYSAEGTSVFEEGLTLPPMKLYRKGVLNQEVLDILAGNVRVPDQVLGDVQAQISAARMGAYRTSELMAETGLRDLSEISAAVLERSEKAMRAAIRRAPDGVYHSEGMLDGFDHPLAIKLKLTISGDTLELDFEGTSPQINKGINSCYNFTYGYAAFGVKAVLEPLVPNNEGAYRPIVMKAPEHSLVNSSRPAPGNSRGRVGHIMVPIVFGALAQAVPDLVPAESGTPAPRLNFFGPREDGSQFQYLLVNSGGLGASATRDGLSAKSFPTNTKMASIEVTETRVPLRFNKRELIADSGGRGCHRGGLGQEIEIEVLGKNEVFVSTVAERVQFPPAGYQGGGPGAPTKVLRNGGYLAPKARTTLQPGDLVTVCTPGGGGFGNAQERSAASIAEDVLQENVTAPDADSKASQHLRSEVAPPRRSSAESVS